MTPQIAPVAIPSDAPLPIPSSFGDTSIVFEGMNGTQARFISMVIE
jgi:hypothetical protein